MLLIEGGVEQAVAAVRAGAADCVRIPVDPEDVVFVVGKALGSHSRADASPPSVASGGIVFGSKPMLQVEDMIRRAARGEATVLIRGESGTGKELVARALHEQSPRRAGPFVKIHCAALPDTLVESELFGYEKGAFTGATTRKPGRVEIASSGTLFLDEIGDITAAVQMKLLRLLQDREYERLGGTQTLRADVRFVAATRARAAKRARAVVMRRAWVGSTPITISYVPAASATVHGFYYLESPPFDTTGSSPVFLSTSRRTRRACRLPSTGLPRSRSRVRCASQGQP